MSHKRLVFVLGAGSSVPYGYPSGRELVQRIVTPGPGSPSFTATNRSDFEAFREKLANCKARSIDAFLGRDKRRTFEDVGKLAIAETLIRCELHGRIFYDTVQDDWYEYVFNLCLADKTDIQDAQGLDIAFVTFNYDRSLEHFLFTFLVNNFDTDPVVVADIIGRCIPIVHVYGSLGPLPWQDATIGRAYSSVISPDIVQKAADSITILHQGKDDSEAFCQAHKLFEDADIIYILGFGYHSENMRRLKIPFERLGGHSASANVKPLRIFGTTFGLTDAEARQVCALYGNQWLIGNVACQICDSLRTGSFIDGIRK